LSACADGVGAQCIGQKSMLACQERFR
jgi:hypothetical protein